MTLQTMQRAVTVQSGASQGCTCPVLDNGHGNEEPGRARGFWINLDCPVHILDGA